MPPTLKQTRNSWPFTKGNACWLDSRPRPTISEPSRAVTDVLATFQETTPMLHLCTPRAGGRFLGAILAGLVLLVPAWGASPETLDTSLKLVPADAAFYTASLRNTEQFAAIGKSKAWAKFKALPFVQKAWKEGWAELNKAGGAVEQYEAFRKDPENQQLIDLLNDMVA